MEKLALKGKKEIRSILGDSLQKTVQALGLNKSKGKTVKVINKAAKRIAELVADQLKKEMKKIKDAEGKKEKKLKKEKNVKKVNKVKKEKKEKKVKPLKASKVKKSKKVKEPDLEIA